MSRTLYAFPIFSVRSIIFTPLMEGWCIVFLGNQFSLDKVNLKKVPEPFISPRYTRNFCAKTHFSHKPSLLIASIVKHRTKYVNKRANQQAGVSRLVFLTVKYRKKINACSSIKKSIERHPRILYHSPPLFPPLQLALLPESASRARDAEKAAQCVFPL